MHFVDYNCELWSRADPTRAYFWPNPKIFFWPDGEKIEKFDVFRGNFPNPNLNHRWLTQPNPSKKIDPDPSLRWRLSYTDIPKEEKASNALDFIKYVHFLSIYEQSTGNSHQSRESRMPSRIIGLNTNDQNNDPNNNHKIITMNGECWDQNTEYNNQIQFYSTYALCSVGGCHLLICYKTLTSVPHEGGEGVWR